jgi:hypothetical protein
MTPQEIEGWVKAIMNLGSPVFTIVACIGIGYFFRAIPKFNNEWLWVVCGIAGAIMFPVLAYAHREMYGFDEGLAVWLVRTIPMGLILGMGAWAVHDKILSKIENKLPILKNFVAFVDKTGKQLPPSSPPEV